MNELAMTSQLFSDPRITAIVMVFSVPIVAVIAYYWHEVLKTRSNNKLKQSMVNRGMSVDEIERVMNAGTPPKKKPIRHVEQRA